MSIGCATVPPRHEREFRALDQYGEHEETVPDFLHVHRRTGRMAPTKWKELVGFGRWFGRGYSGRRPFAKHGGAGVHHGRNLTNLYNLRVCGNLLGSRKC